MAGESRAAKGLATGRRLDGLVPAPSFRGSQARVRDTLIQRGQQGKRWPTLGDAADCVGCTPDKVRMRIERRSVCASRRPASL